MEMDNTKIVFLTGGTGSFGTNFIPLLLSKPEIKMIRIYSRDEHKQQALKEQYRSDRISFYIGDVRDYDNLKRSMADSDWVVHAAALKQAPFGEIYPEEFIKTNILGSSNVAKAALDNNIDKCLLLSTDKAVYPLNLYGATKMCAERLFINLNRMKGTKQTKFACTRYGNVANSRGTIVQKFLSLGKTVKVPITNPDATRFWIPMHEANEFVYSVLLNMRGGEIFIPKIRSIKVGTVAHAICPDREWTIIGERPGDKLHEVLIGENESFTEYENYYVIEGYSSSHPAWSSNKNGDYLSTEQILESINGCRSGLEASAY